MILGLVRVTRSCASEGLATEASSTLPRPSGSAGPPALPPNHQPPLSPRGTTITTSATQSAVPVARWSARRPVGRSDSTMAAPTPTWTQGDAQRRLCRVPDPPGAGNRMALKPDHQEDKQAPPGRRRAPGAPSGPRRWERPAGPKPPSQRGNPRQSSPALRLATRAPNRITRRPNPAVACTRGLSRCLASDRLERQPRCRSQEGNHHHRQQHHGVEQVDDDDRRGEVQLDDDRAEEDLDDQEDQGDGGRLPEGGILTVAAPGDARKDRDGDGDQRRHPAVADFDQGREVQGREPLAVASGPGGAATQPRAGDPDHTAEDDQARR